ncbi:DEAD/DEAH box helicase [Peredibacter starrii]|uniref:DEAD/DEAH box helicase n=1 Tax=Peredibacter starrii TaxID=28202 RepID=A0AAX4HTY6_9BACT|nr:DEAD/DEAH box helicase [Peredibacter starrii]WPU66686.1 DEAD/DEAH box helicase [Peredibacter starrii]
MSDFKNLGLSNELAQNLAELKYVSPTPIQSEAIPLILKGHDLLGIAQTGTGKSAAFLLPIIQQTNNCEVRKAEPLVLILAPTRELCIQIDESIQAYAKNLSLKSCAIFGGVEQEGQVKRLQEGVQIVVATPGRLLDLVEQKLLRLAKVESFVLDEADRMLDMGFIDDINFILEKLTERKQTMLFSATMPAEIQKLASTILRDPKTVEVTPVSSVAKNIEQKVIFCKKTEKFQLLKKILKEEEIELVLVFAKTKNIVDNIVEYLAQNRRAARAIHGDKTQEERERAILHFKEKVVKILVATDIASRGIDIDGVSHVINFDIPIDPESYVHRIGRTARAGKAGIAISFCDEEEKPSLEKIQKLSAIKFKTEKFHGGGGEGYKVKAVAKKTTAPTPGKSQEKNAWLDHSKRQTLQSDGSKRVHPGMKNNKKKRR